MNPSLSYCQNEKLRIFVASRTIFAGPNALIRRSKKIHDLVLQYPKPLKQVVDEYGIDRVTVVIKILLESKAYESESAAKLLLPELYVKTVARGVQGAEAERNTLESGAEALKDVKSNKENGGDHDGIGTMDELKDEPQGSMDTLVATASSPSDAFHTLPPCYLPFKVQHVLLTTIQSLLEETAFTFASNWIPSLLEDENWDCAEAVELKKWNQILEKRWRDLPSEAIDVNKDVSFNTVLFSANELQDSAVHRRPITGMEVEQLVLNAMKYAKALRDESKSTQLKYLHLELEKRLRDMDLNKNLLEYRFKEELQVIAEERAELDRREKNALAKLRQADREHGLLIGSILEASVRNIFARDVALPFEGKEDLDEAQGDVSQLETRYDSDEGGITLPPDDKGRLPVGPAF